MKKVAPKRIPKTEEQLVMGVLLIAVMKRVLLKTIVRVSVTPLLRPVTRASITRVPIITVTRSPVTRAPITGIILTVNILKPRVNIESVLYLIIKSGHDEIIRDILNGVNLIINVRVGITL